MHMLDRDVVRVGHSEWNLRVCLLLLAQEGQLLNILLFEEIVFLNEKRPPMFPLSPCVPAVGRD